MKYVGRYPDTDSALAHRALAKNRLTEVSMTTAQIQQQLNDRIANYVTPAQVDSSTTGKLSKSALAADVNNYWSTSDPGKIGPNTGLATIVSGKIPLSQLPSISSYPQAHALEMIPPLRRVNVMSTSTTATSTSETFVGSFTLSDPGYAWIPIMSGTFEVNIISGTPPAIVKIRDYQGRVVAGGWSSRRSGVNRLHVNPETIPQAYLGGVTFNIYLFFATGTGQLRSTNWEDSLMALQVPWNG